MTPPPPDLDMPLCVEHDVVQLEVAVHNVVAVKKCECEDNLCCIEAGPGLVKLACALDLEHEVTPRHKLHDKEELVDALEGRVHACEERVVVCEGEHTPLRHDALNIVVFEDGDFLQDFDGADAVCFPVLCQQHFAKGPTPQHLQQRVVVDGLRGRAVRLLRRGADGVGVCEGV